jgi:CubicO group peptidase (beta-lactamase class C family)
MFFLRLAVLLAAVTNTLAGPTSAQAQQSDNPAVDAIFSDLTKPGSPGCAVGIYRDGKIIYAKGYGLANIEDKVPITPDTVFDIASISKQFVAASILLLVMQGKLRLSEDVRKYIPELPDYSAVGGRKITILDMLSHSSGLRDYPSLFLLSGIHPDNVTTDRDALASILRQKNLNFRPGTDWQYSNSGYFLLALIVKQVSGKSLKEFAQENIFQPLGMTHTQFRNDHTALIPQRSLAYDQAENGDYKLDVPYFEEAGSGQLHTSIGDFQRWDENFYSGSVGGKDFATQMEQPAKLNDGTAVAYAKGLFIGNYRGVRTVWHSGASGGYRAYYLRFPEQHFSVVCLCNRAGLDRERRAREVADLYLAEALKPKANTSNLSLTPAELKALTGTYRDALRQEVWRVSEEGGKLRVEFEGSLLQLRPLSATQFVTVGYPIEIQLRFEPARGGAPRRLVIDTWDQRPLPAEAISEAHPSLGLAGFAGDYWSDELRATYRLAANNGKLWIKELIGADGIVHEGTVPFDELRPVVTDEFDLKGSPFVIHFKRDAKQSVSGFTLNGFHMRGIVFSRLPNRK